MAVKKVASKVADANPVKMPITFKEFAKEPVKGLMFICIIAVGYLYVDIKMSNSETQTQLNHKIEVLENKVDLLTNALRKSDSTSSALASKIAVLQELGKIK
jgi:hypothetical protein